MPLVWASLALAIVLSTYGAVVVFRKGRALWRDFVRTTQALDESLAEVSRNAALAASKAGALDTVTTRVDASTSRLHVSLARLAVLRAAIGDVRHAAGRVGAVYPRK